MRRHLHPRRLKNLSYRSFLKRPISGWQDLTLAQCYEPSLSPCAPHGCFLAICNVSVKAQAFYQLLFLSAFLIQFCCFHHLLRVISISDQASRSISQLPFQVYQCCRWNIQPVHHLSFFFVCIDFT